MAKPAKTTKPVHRKIVSRLLKRPSGMPKVLWKFMGPFLASEDRLWRNQRNQRNHPHRSKEQY